MNDPTPFVSQDEIDLLSEWELGVAEREHLFSLLDQDSTGWKRAALALLEVQALRTNLSFRSVSCLESSDSFPERDVTRPQMEKTKTRLLQGGRQFLYGLLAASLVFAIGISWGERPAKRTVADRINQPVDDLPTDSPPKNKPLHPLAQRLAKNQAEWTREMTLAAQSVSIPHSQLIAFVAVEHAGKQQIYPIVESLAMQKQLADLSNPTLPGALTDRFQKAGWAVKPQKQLLSFHLPDGTCQTMPIGMLDLYFVGPETF